MNVTRIVLTGGAVLALAACGGSSASTTSTSAAPPTMSAAAAASVDAATASVVCAAVNALVQTGDSGTDAIATAARAHNITQAQVVYAIDDRCPALKGIVPRGE